MFRLKSFFFLYLVLPYVKHNKGVWKSLNSFLIHNSRGLGVLAVFAMIVIYLFLILNEITKLRDCYFFFWMQEDIKVLLLIHNLDMTLFASKLSSQFIHETFKYWLVEVGFRRRISIIQYFLHSMIKVDKKFLDVFLLIFVKKLMQHCW